MSEPKIRYLLVETSKVSAVKMVHVLTQMFDLGQTEEAMMLLLKLYPTLSHGAAYALLSGEVAVEHTDEGVAITVTYEQDERQDPLRSARI